MRMTIMMNQITTIFVLQFVPVIAATRMLPYLVHFVYKHLFLLAALHLINHFYSYPEFLFRFGIPQPYELKLKA